MKNLEATLGLEYENEKIAEAVAMAISPDNFKVPEGLQVKTWIENREVITKINCKGELATFISTIDDLLFCVTVAEKALGVIRI